MAERSPGDSASSEQLETLRRRLREELTSVDTTIAELSTLRKQLVDSLKRVEALMRRPGHRRDPD